MDRLHRHHDPVRGWLGGDPMKPDFPAKQSHGKVSPIRGKSVRKLDADSADDLPSRESTAPGRKGWVDGGRDQAWISLRRFLVKRVGRSWNDIYSEVSALKDLHLKDVLKQLVKIDTFVDRDGDIAVLVGVYGCPPVKAIESPGCFYVDPASGLLRQTPKTKHVSPERAVPYKLINGSYYLSMGGIWYTATIAVVPPPFASSWPRTVPAIDTLPAGQGLLDLWIGGKQHRLTHRNQLSSKDLKRLGLVNSPQPDVPKHLRIQRAKQADRAKWGH